MYNGLLFFFFWERDFLRRVFSIFQLSLDVITLMLHTYCMHWIKRLYIEGIKKLLFFFAFLDVTEPTDDDVIMHILRLRGKLGWQTKLPSWEYLAREADVARLQKLALTVTFAFPSPHPVRLHIPQVTLVIYLKYVSPGSFSPLKTTHFALEPYILWMHSGYGNLALSQCFLWLRFLSIK